MEQSRGCAGGAGRSTRCGWRSAVGIGLFVAVRCAVHRLCVDETVERTTAGSANGSVVSSGTLLSWNFIWFLRELTIFHTLCFPKWTTRDSSVWCNVSYCCALLNINCSVQAHYFSFCPNFNCICKSILSTTDLAIDNRLNSFPVMVSNIKYEPHHFLVFGHILVNFWSKIKVNSVLESWESRASI